VDDNASVRCKQASKRELKWGEDTGFAASQMLAGIVWRADMEVRW
jgi:hypothetical protein